VAIRTTSLAITTAVLGRPAVLDWEPVVLSRNQIAVPTQQCVRSDDAGHVAKRGSTQRFRAHGQPAALVVGQSHPALPQLLPKHPILFDKVVDRRALSALDPAGKRPDDELQQKSVHASHRNPGADRRAARVCANTQPTFGTIRGMGGAGRS
jgi:hypothetical protein